MAALDLVTLAQVQTAYPDLDAQELTDLPSVISAASVEIAARYPFAAPAQWRDENRDPGYDRDVLLSFKPVLRIGRIRADMAPIMNLAYSGAARTATVEILSAGEANALVPTGIEIVETTAGIVGAPAEFPFATYPTVGALASAVGLRTSWTATVAPNQTDMPSGDVEPGQGPLNAAGRAVGIQAYTRDLADWKLDRTKGRVLLYEWRQESYSFPGREWACDPRKTMLRITYQAGWTAIPADVVRAAILVIGDLIESTANAGPIAQVASPDGGYRLAGPTYKFPDAAERALSRYKNRRFS